MVWNRLTKLNELGKHSKVPLLNISEKREIKRPINWSDKDLTHSLSPQNLSVVLACKPSEMRCKRKNDLKVASFDTGICSECQNAHSRCDGSLRTSGFDVHVQAKYQVEETGLPKLEPMKVLILFKLLTLDQVSTSPRSSPHLLQGTGPRLGKYLIQVQYHEEDEDLGRPQLRESRFVNLVCCLDTFTKPRSPQRPITTTVSIPSKFLCQRLLPCRSSLCSAFLKVYMLKVSASY